MQEKQPLNSLAIKIVTGIYCDTMLWYHTELHIYSDGTVILSGAVIHLGTHLSCDGISLDC